MVPAFMFATGIENSSPTINHGKHRIDEMQKCFHYKPGATTSISFTISESLSCARASFGEEFGEVGALEIVDPIGNSALTT